MIGKCAGTADRPCCYIRGKLCPFSEEGTVEGRRWACGLRRELGDWDAVLASDRYQEHVAPTFEPLGMNCRDWPEPGNACATCGVEF